VSPGATPSKSSLVSSKQIPSAKRTSHIFKTKSKKGIPLKQSMIHMGSTSSLSGIGTQLKHAKHSTSSYVNPLSHTHKISKKKMTLGKTSQICFPNGHLIRDSSKKDFEHEVKIKKDKIWGRNSFMGSSASQGSLITRKKPKSSRDHHKNLCKIQE